MVGTSKLPGSTLIAMIANFRAIGQWDSTVMILVAILSSMELIILCAILRRIFITAGVLQKAQY